MFLVRYEMNHRVIAFNDNFPVPDLYVREIGYSAPPPGYAITPQKRPVYVLHYVTKGLGTVMGVPVQAPCCFLLPANQVHTYRIAPEPDNQWEHFWIMFDGTACKRYLESAGFSSDFGVYPAPQITQIANLFHGQLQQESSASEGAFDLLALLFRLFAFQSHNQAAQHPCRQKSPHVQRALRFIESSYALNIGVEEIARAIGVSAKHLYKLFKKETGSSPKDSLTKYRICRANELLQDPSLTIAQIAALTGFGNPDYFSQVFKKVMGGVSPSQFRKIHLP